MLLEILFIRKCWSIDSYWAPSQQETTSINQTLTKKLRNKMFSRFQKPLHLAGRHFSTTGGRNKTVAVMGASGGKGILILNGYWRTNYLLYCNVMNHNIVYLLFFILHRYRSTSVNAFKAQSSSNEIKSLRHCSYSRGCGRS